MSTHVLPLLGLLDRSSGPKSQGFDINVVSYSSKISQKAFDGPSQEASRNERWTVRWKMTQRLTPQEVIDSGNESTYDTIKAFYELNYIRNIEWKPFEVEVNRVWKIVPNSFKQSNTAGCIFDVKFDIEFLYNI